jgi:hypothetical protein
LVVEDLIGGGADIPNLEEIARDPRTEDRVRDDNTKQAGWNGMEIMRPMMEILARGGLALNGEADTVDRKS